MYIYIYATTHIGGAWLSHIPKSDWSLTDLGKETWKWKPADCAVNHSTAT